MRYRNPVCDVPRLDTYLAAYRQEVARLDQLKRRPSPLTTARMLARVSVENVDLFHGLLQQFDMRPKLRLEVEAAARFWNRVYPFHLKGEPVALPAPDSLAQMKAHLAVAERARREGRPHDECRVGKAHREVLVGGFRIINTGGFDKNKMRAVTSVVEDAAKRLIAHGLGCVLYGEINVTNELEDNTLAFYERRHDAMYVRADVRMQQSVIRTVAHELAHRLELLYIVRDSQIEELYDAIKKANKQATQWAMMRIRRLALRDGKPAFDSVTRTIAPEYREKYREIVRLHGGFVTAYAATDAGENFAEMVAYYCMDALPANERKRLLAVIPAHLLNLPPPATHAAKLVDDVGREQAMALASDEVALRNWKTEDAIREGALDRMDLRELLDKSYADRGLSRYWTQVKLAIPTS